MDARNENLAQVPDTAKLQIISQLIATMAPDFKQLVINELARNQSAGEIQLNVTSDDQYVRLDFGRALAWFILPKKHALELGQLLMEHAGATLQRIEKPPAPGSSPGEPPIDVKPENSTNS